MINIKVGSRVVVASHETHQGSLGIVYHLEQEKIFLIASVALDYGVDAIDIPVDCIELHSSSAEGKGNPAWEDLKIT